MEEYLSQLNEQQRKAVEYIDGPSLVISGAGAGKTRVLTYKIVHLLNNGFDAHRILALTFTNKAAREMKERIAKLTGPEVSSKLWMGTFHSIFLRILRTNSEAIGFKSSFTIYDTADSKALIKTIIKELGLDDKDYKASSVLSQISNAKNALISPMKYASNPQLLKADKDCKRPLIYQIYSEYWKRCKVANAMDFDDILYYTNVLLRDFPDVLQKYQDFFQYILVDEYQDTNFAQHIIIAQLCRKNRKLCVVGDDAQSIYSFRGANIKNILTLDSQFPDLKIFKLEQNYRSTQNIINAANTLICKNTQQIPKQIFSTNKEGSKIEVIQSYTGYEESYVIANKIVELKKRESDTYDDFAVLYRTNAQSRVIEEALRKRSIPYRIYGGLSFYQRKEVKDVISYFRLTVNPDDDEALRRVINYPPRGIGEGTLKKLQQSATEQDCSLWEAISKEKLPKANLNKGIAAKVEMFRSLISTFIEQNNKSTNAYEMAQTIIGRANLLSVLMSDNTPENISKQENIKELLSGANEFVATRMEEGNDNLTLTHFLSEISLATDQDSDSESDDGARVTLMTVHAAKGLEFDNVIICGLEEELFPSFMSSDSLAGIEEERRLMYVAITRAKTNCVITYANTRFINGQTKICNPSRFIKDIDSRYLRMSQTSSTTDSHSDYFERNLNSWREPSYQTAPKPSLRDSLMAATEQKKSAVATTAATSSFTSHTADELHNGQNICHSRFGDGTIISIDTSTSDHKITVRFSNCGEKVLLLKFARFALK